MADIELGVVLKADGTAFVRDVRKAKGEVGGLGKEGQAAGKKMDGLGNKSQGASGKVKQLGRSGFEAAKGLLLVGGAVATIVAAATGVVKTTGELDTALAGVAAVSGATTEQMSALEAQARDLGATTQFAAAEAAGAQEFLAKAGFTVDQTMQSTEATLRLAAAGTLDLGRAADISSNILSAFGKEASELDNVVDIMAATASRANTDVEQLGLAMQYTAPIAKAMGVSIEETAAAIGVLSNAGLQGEKAGTGLRNIFIKLANPSDRLKEILGDLSLETDGLAPLMRRLATSGLSAGEAMDIFGAEAGPAFNVMSAGAADLSDMAEGLRDVDGVAESIANKRMDTLAGDWKQFNSALSELQITVGRGGLQEGLRTIVQGMTEATRTAGHFVKALTEVGDQTDETGADVERFGATNIDVSEQIISALGILVDVYRTSFSTIGAGFQALGRTLGAGGAQIVALFQGRFSDILEIGNAWKDDMGVIFEDLGNLDTRAFRDKLEEIRTAAQMREPVREMEALADALSSAIPGLGGSAGALGDLGGAAGDAAGKLDAAGDAADDAGDSAGDAADKFRDLNEVWGQMAVAQLEAGAAAMKDIDKRVEGVIDATRTEREQIEITRRERIRAIEDAVRVQRISAEEAADLRRRVDEDYWRGRADLERGHMIDLADLQEELWLDSLRGVRQGFVDFYGDTIREGEITWKSLWGSFKDLAIDAIAQVAAALTVNGLLGLFNIGGGDGGGLSLNVAGGGGGGTGNAIVNAGASKAIQAAGKKYLPQVFGGTTSGAGQQAIQSGVQTYALESSAPIAGQALGAGAQQLTQAQATQVLTSQAAYSSGSAAGGSAASTASMSALAAPALAIAAGYVLDNYVFGPSDPARARGSFRGFDAMGPLGTQIGVGRDFAFAGGPNAGFAREFAKERGINAFEADVTTGLQAFEDVGGARLITILEEAEAKFEEVKVAGASAFQAAGAAAADIGQKIQDGVITPAELAALGIEGIGHAYEHPKTGVTELREITAGEFGEIAKAINSGELRLRALQGELDLTEREMEVLGRIGVDVAGRVAQGFGQIGPAAWAAANDANEALGSIQDRKVTLAVERKSFGGPASSRSPQVGGGGLAAGTSFVPRDMTTTIHKGEMVIDPRSSDALRKYGIQVQGGGSDAETKQLLRTLGDQLTRVERAIVESGAQIGGKVDQNTKQVKRSGATNPGLSRKAA